jgi:hypothetical protein
MPSSTPQNWYILQRDGVIYLCHSDELMTPIRNYIVNRDMWVCVYDDTDEYILDPSNHHPNHQARPYNFWVEFCVWNLPRRA